MVLKLMNKKKPQKAKDFQAYLKEQLKNPVLKKYYSEYGEQLKISYRILKIKKKDSQRWAEQ
jgi:predicted metal-dependent hydrolase